VVRSRAGAATAVVGGERRAGRTPDRVPNRPAAPALVARSSARPSPIAPAADPVAGSAKARPGRSAPPPKEHRSQTLARPPAQPAAPPAEAGRGARARRPARGRAGLRAGIAVLDLRSGRYFGAGQADAQFAPALVVKVLIAATCSPNHEMTGPTADLAYSMITRSDDEAGNALWEQVGRAGDRAVDRAALRPDRSRLAQRDPRTMGQYARHAARIGAAVRGAAERSGGLAVARERDAHAVRVAKDAPTPVLRAAAASTRRGRQAGWGSGSADEDGAATVNSTGYLDPRSVRRCHPHRGLRPNNDTTDARGTTPRRRPS